MAYRERSSTGYGGGSRDGRSRGGYGGGFRGRSSGGYGRDRDSGPREMHDVICDKCGKECQVPFRPTAGKPVLCSDCFSQSGRDRGSRDGSRGFNRDRGFDGGRDRQSSGSGVSSAQIAQINAKLDKIMKILGLEEDK